MAVKGVPPILEQLDIPIEALEALAHLKGSKEWAAIRYWMRVYIDLQKNLAWRLNEEDEKFSIKHAKYTSRVQSLRDLEIYIERYASKRLDEEFESDAD